MSCHPLGYCCRQLLAVTLICWRCGRRVLTTNLDATWCATCRNGQ
jgi:hypothetical protein